MSQRASNDDVIPLCPAHHRGVNHQGPSIHMNRRAFVDRFGTEEQLINIVKRLIDDIYR
jgi:hypothetical protein